MSNTIPLRNKPSANTAAVVTIEAESGVAIELDEIVFSYGATPTGGNLKVESPSGTTIFEVDIVGGGPGPIPFVNGLKGAVGQAVIVTLAAGGSGIQGQVNVLRKQ